MMASIAGTVHSGQKRLIDYSLLSFILYTKARYKLHGFKIAMTQSRVLAIIHLDCSSYELMIEV